MSDEISHKKEEGEYLIYVMSDIHGMYDKYIEMLKMINFNDDILYVLGDVVDRGYDSMKILKDMMSRFNIYPIIGNHELMAIECLDLLSREITDELLNDLDEVRIMKLSDWINNGAYQTIREFKTLSQDEQNDVIEYLMEFTAYEEVNVNGKYFLLVHAGIQDIDENKSLDDYDINDFVWKHLDWETPCFHDSNKYVIVGHTPTLGITRKSEIFHRNRWIDIDCGACFKEGKLACLCLDTMEDFYV